MVNHQRTNQVLASIDRKFLDVGRLMQNERYANALLMINEIKRNLLRIRDQLTEETFIAINDSVDQLMNICEGHVNNMGTDSVHNYHHEYKARKIYSGR